MPTRPILRTRSTRRSSRPMRSLSVRTPLVMRRAMRTGAPEWIMVIPAGQFSGRDGRGPFKLSNPQKVLDATAKADMKAGLPLDYDHATDSLRRTVGARRRSPR